MTVYIKAVEDTSDPDEPVAEPEPTEKVSDARYLVRMGREVIHYSMENGQAVRWSTSGSHRDKEYVCDICHKWIKTTSAFWQDGKQRCFRCLQR